MSKSSRREIIGGDHKFEIIMRKVEEYFAPLHTENTSTQKPVRRKTITFAIWLNKIEVALRREVWPTMADIDNGPDIESLEKQVEKRLERATPKQRELWSLLLMVGTLRGLLEVTTTDGNAIALQAVKIYAGLSAVTPGNPEWEAILDGLKATLATVQEQTSQKAFEKNYNQTLYNRDPRNNRPGPKPKYTKQERREAVDAMRVLVKQGSSVTNAVEEIQKQKGLYGRDSGYWRDEYYRMNRRPKKKPHT